MKVFYKNCAEDHQFSLYLNPNYNTLSIILTDNYALISIYRLAPEKTTVPHFVFKKGGPEYDRIKADIEKIECPPNKYKLN